MRFKSFLESVVVSQMDSDGSRCTIVYPSGVYQYNTDYGALVNQLYKQYNRAPGRFANKLKELVSKGYATVKKIS